MKNGMHKAIWLHIHHEGGTWTADEIGEEFGIDRQKANVAMHNMAARAKQLQRGRRGSKTAFHVTDACVIPGGVTLKELQQGPAPRQQENSVFGLGIAAAYEGARQ